MCMTKGVNQNGERLAKARTENENKTGWKKCPKNDAIRVFYFALSLYSSPSARLCAVRALADPDHWRQIDETTNDGQMFYGRLSNCDLRAKPQQGYRQQILGFNLFHHRDAVPTKNNLKKMREIFSNETRTSNKEKTNEK